MTPQQIGALVDGGIPFALGVFTYLQGYRVIGKPAGADPKWDDWHSRYGKLMRIAGPFLILFGLWQGIAPYTKAAAAEAPVESLSTFPTRVGATWEYQGASGVITMRIAAHETFVGVRCARREVVSDNTVVMTDHVRPSLGIVYKQGFNQGFYAPAFPILKDLAAPTRWDYRSEDGTLEFQCDQKDGGPLKTPMGLIEKTVLVTMRGKEKSGETLTESWYAPGVGLVKEHTRTGGNEYLIEIKSYKP